MQASVQHYPTEDLNTADTSCPSRTLAEHFDDRPVPCPEKKNARIPVSMWLSQQPWSTDRTEDNWLQRIHLLTAAGAPRLQVCINAVELAIIANSISLDTVFESCMHCKVPYSSQWCLEKNYWADSECALNVVATAVISHNRSCLTSCFTFYSFFTTLVATRRCRCLLRSARVNVMPERLSVISGLAGGSLVSALSFVAFHPLTWPLLCFCVFFVLLLFRWPLSLWHTRCHHACYSHCWWLSHSSVFCLVWLWLCVFVFVCFFFGVVWFWWDCSLECVLVHYQRFWGYRRIDGLTC